MKKIINFLKEFYFELFLILFLWILIIQELLRK